MGNVVFASIKRIDFAATTVDVDVVQSVGRVFEKQVLVDLDSVPMSDLAEHNVYIPATLLDSAQGKNVQVYHELSLYPFFRKAKEIILGDEVPIGVFRLHRVLEGRMNRALIASDLCVLSSVFGEVKRIDVKHSRADLLPQHVIVTALFNGGTMAHVDYTFSRKELLELEWSGVKKIIEFDSEGMSPFKPNQDAMSPLKYTVDSILANSVHLNEVIPEFQEFQQLIGGA